MPSTNYAYVNGRFVPEKEATVSIFDRGFLYGDGVFETMRVYGGKIFRLKQHLQRLRKGQERLKIDITEDGYSELFTELIARNGVNEGVVRLYVTRGVGDGTWSPKTVNGPTVVALAGQRSFESDPRGLRLIVSSVYVSEHALLADLKTANRLPYVLAKLEAEQAGADEAVILNENGWVMDCSAANIFAIMNDKLFTPSLYEGALPGIAKCVVLELAAKLELPVDECGVQPSFLEESDELFVTSSSLEVAPVAEFNGKTLLSHTITHRLRAAYRQLVCEELLL